MKKKLLILIAAVVLVLAILLGGFPLLSQLVYHRSQAATILAWQFHKNAYTTQEAFDEYLAEKREENQARYTVPEDVSFTVSVSECEQAGMQVFILNEAAADQGRVIFYLHGGSYIDQPTATHWKFANAVAADTGSAVVVPVYPELPDHTVQDVLPALAEVYAECLRDTDPNECILMGDSAGGGLALSMAMRLRDEGPAAPDKLILICPWVDVTLENPDIAAYEKVDGQLDRAMLQHLGVLWAGGLATDDPAVSPLYGDLSGLGSVTLFTTPGEILYPDILLLSERLREAGTPCSVCLPEGTLFHVWPLYASFGVPESEQAYDQIVEAITA